MSWIWPVAILLGIMILIHELGHYWAAISVGIRVDTFSIGFGPRLFGFKRGDTDFRISALPLGGYVRMYGELPGEEEAAADPRSFLGKARWQRAIVVVAGPLMNVVLAIAILTGLYMHGFAADGGDSGSVISAIKPDSPAARAGFQPGDRIIQIGSDKNPNWEDVLNTTALNAGRALPVTVQRNRSEFHSTVTPQLDAQSGVGDAGWDAIPDFSLRDILPGTPAARAGLRPGDTIVSIDQKPIVSPESIVTAVKASNGQPLQVLYKRNGQLQRVSITPERNNDPKLPWRLGIQIGPKEIAYPFGAALVQSLRTNEKYATLIFKTITGLVQHRVSPKSLQGPVAIAGDARQAVQAGFSWYLDLMALVSINLAIMNLLPIPILDGGTLLMLLIEMILQREVSLQAKEFALKIGFVCLMILVVFVMYNDISHLLPRG